MGLGGRNHIERDGAPTNAGLEVILLSAGGALLGWSSTDAAILESGPGGWRLNGQARDAVLAAARRLGGAPGPVVVRLETEAEPVFGCLALAFDLPADLRPKLRTMTVPDERALALVLPASGVRDDLARLVQDSFGLTPAEARLAVLIRDGLSLNEAAKRTGLSVNTLRNQLRAVFDKTGLNRQSDLARVLTQLSNMGRSLAVTRSWREEEACPATAGRWRAEAVSR